jgi:hypothetical protein
MFKQDEREQELNDLLDRVTAVLAAWGIEVSSGRAAGPDATVDMDVELDAGARGMKHYPTVIKRGRLDRARATAMALPSERPVLVLAPHVPDAAADALSERGAQFVDGAGNVRLAWDGMSLDVRGYRPRATSVPRKDPSASRAFTRSGAKVVFALLSWPGLTARPVREIAAASGTAVGTVHAVMSALAGAGYVYESDGGAGLNRAGELLERWAEAYAVNLARKLDLGSFSMADPGRAGDLERAMLDHGALLGGELAGSRIDPNLRPTTATFYVDEVPAELVAKFRLRRDDADGTVHVRRRFWQRQQPDTTLVPSPLVYADLVSSGDPRQREHAERIRSVDDRLVELDRS